MVGHGGSSAGSYLADPTSPIPSHCIVIILFKSAPVHQLSRLALYELTLGPNANNITAALQNRRYFWFKYNLGKKYHVPQVRPDWGSNSWPPDPIPSTEITLPVLCIMTRGIAGSQVTLCGKCSRSWQYSSCHCDACSNHSAISDFCQ